MSLQFLSFAIFDPPDQIWVAAGKVFAAKSSEKSESKYLQHLQINFSSNQGLGIMWTCLFLKQQKQNQGFKKEEFCQDVRLQVITKLAAR